MGDAQRHYKEGVLAGGVGGQEFGYSVVVEGQAGGAQPQGMGRQVDAPADDAGQGLRHAVAARPEVALHRIQVGGDECHGGGIGGQGLLEAEMPGDVAEIAAFEPAETVVEGVVVVGAGGESVHGVDDEIAPEIRFQPAGQGRSGDAGAGGVNDAAEGFPRYWLPGEAPG